MEAVLFRVPLRYIILVGLAILVLFVVLPLLYTLYWPLSQPPPDQFADIKIRFGTPADSIAVMLEKAGVVRSVSQFKRALRILDERQNLRAGRFRLPQTISNYKAIKALTQGPQILTKVTVPEGLTVRKIARIFKQELGMDSLKIVQLAGDADFAGRFGIGTANLEGYLLPETYMFPYGITEKQVVTQLVGQFKKTVWDTLYLRSQEMGFTTVEIITLAAIIQAEAKLNEEMPVISSVYHNRLRLGIPLQADPTIQYIIPDGPRRLLFRDLEIESPYNTYRYKGLPPGPINNPGKQAIWAALYPAATDYLFFVANTKGGHSFSADYRRHINAKKVLDRERKRVYRGK